MSAAACPTGLPKIKPYLIKAEEFQAKQPLIAYYLRTYAAHLGLKSRNPQDKEATTFLMGLLQQLEGEKASNAEIATADGRTVLTRVALMLFTKADDMERAGQVNEMIIKLFYTSSLLLEATCQFVDEMDPIASEKHTYAQFVARKMKKSLQTGAPYVSPNGAAEAQVPMDGGAADGGVPDAMPPAEPPMPSAAPVEVLPPSAPPTGPIGGFDMPPPPPAQETYSPPPPAPVTQPPPPPVAPPHQPTPPAPTAAPPQPTYTPPPAASGADPTMDQMINAQKFAKQAVSALQFYDHVNARQQLLSALAALDGK